MVYSPPLYLHLLLASGVPVKSKDDATFWLCLVKNMSLCLHEGSSERQIVAAVKESPFYVKCFPVAFVISNGRASIIYFCVKSAPTFSRH